MLYQLSYLTGGAGGGLSRADRHESNTVRFAPRPVKAGIPLAPGAGITERRSIGREDRHARASPSVATRVGWGAERN